MPHARRYDHDAAYARWQAGETQAAIAASIGVSQSAISQMIQRRDPAGRERINAYYRDYQSRRYRQPCVRGCGRLAWHQQGRTGVCQECERAERRAQAEARDSHGTEARYTKLKCGCADCRRAASEAKRRRREASRVPCSHGCGTLVDSINRRNPDKPPECRPCSLRRTISERRARRQGVVA